MIDVLYMYDKREGSMSECILQSIKDFTEKYMEPDCLLIRKEDYEEADYPIIVKKLNGNLQRKHFIIQAYGYRKGRLDVKKEACWSY